MASTRRRLQVLAACFSLGAVAVAAVEASVDDAAATSCVGVSDLREATAGPLLPARVDVRLPGWEEDAMSATWRDGAVLLSGLADDAEVGTDFRSLAGALPSRLFRGAGANAPKLLSPDAPVSGVHEELRAAERKGMYRAGGGLPPHTDGYVYGDNMPDFVFLLCEEASAVGGANILLDGEALLAGLAAGGGDSAETNAWLAETPVDLTEYSENGVIDGRRAVGPVVQRHVAPSGRTRLKWRRQLIRQEVQRLQSQNPLGDGASRLTPVCPELPSDRYQSLWRPLPSMDAKEAAEATSRLKKFDEVVQRAAFAAALNSTFRLARGEALVVDNYRMLHGRAPYMPASGDTEEGEPDASSSGSQKPARRFWRVWSWTSEGSGLPPDGAKTSQPLDDDVFGKEAQHHARSRSAEF